MNKISVLKNGTFGKVEVILYQYNGLYLVCYREDRILSTKVFDTYDDAIDRIVVDTFYYEDFIPKKESKITKYIIAQSLYSLNKKNHVVRYQTIKEIENGFDNYDILKILNSLN